MKLLILGGTRFVGRYLVTAALERGRAGSYRAFFIVYVPQCSRNGAASSESHSGIRVGNELKAGIDASKEHALLTKWHETHSS